MLFVLAVASRLPICHPAAPRHPPCVCLLPNAGVSLFPPSTPPPPCFFVCGISAPPNALPVSDAPASIEVPGCGRGRPPPSDRRSSDCQTSSIFPPSHLLRFSRRLSSFFLLVLSFCFFRSASTSFFPRSSFASSLFRSPPPINSGVSSSLAAALLSYTEGCLVFASHFSRPLSVFSNLSFLLSSISFFFPFLC